MAERELAARLIDGPSVTLIVGLHHSSPGGGFDGGWIGPIVIALLLMALLAVVFRSKGP